MSYTTFITITDQSTSPIWDGEDVVILAKAFSIKGANIVANKPKTFQDTSLTTADISNGDNSNKYNANLNRRKANVSYGGFNNQTISITCVFNETELGGTSALIEDNVTQIFTPSKLMDLVVNPRTMYIRDESIIPSWIVPQFNSPSFYTSKGMPVVLSDYNITPSLDGKEIIMNMTFIEDKEIS